MDKLNQPPHPHSLVAYVCRMAGCEQRARALLQRIALLELENNRLRAMDDFDKKLDFMLQGAND